MTPGCTILAGLSSKTSSLLLYYLWSYSYYLCQKPSQNRANQVSIPKLRYLCRRSWSIEIVLCYSILKVFLKILLIRGGHQREEVQQFEQDSPRRIRIMKKLNQIHSQRTLTMRSMKSQRKGLMSMKKRRRMMK